MLNEHLHNALLPSRPELFGKAAGLKLTAAEQGVPLLAEWLSDPRSKHSTW